MAEFPEVLVDQDCLEYALRLFNCSEQIYHFIRQCDVKNQGNAGVAVVGLNKGGRAIAELIEELCETEGNKYCFGSLSITREEGNLYHIEVQSNLEPDLSNKVVVIVDSMIITGESAFLAREEINKSSQGNRPKYLGLAVIDDLVGGRLSYIEPDFYINRRGIRDRP